MGPKTKRIFKASALVAATILFAASCTANFCTPEDKAGLLYQKDSGIIRYDNVSETNPQGDPRFSEFTEELHMRARDNGITVPSKQYYIRLDAYANDYALDAYVASGQVVPSQGRVLSKEEINADAEIKNEVLKRYGYVRYLGVENSSRLSYDLNDKDDPAKFLFGNINYWTHQIKLDLDAEGENGLLHIPDTDFKAFYQQEMLRSIGASRSCIAIDGDYYGTPGQQTYIQPKTWGDAWKKGLLEGLFVYPTAALIEFFTQAFGGEGWGQVGAIVLVTLIVRGIMILLTLRSTISQQKMTALQPEMEKLQQKYPNSHVNNYEKQALAQAQMELYKKHGVKPTASLLVFIVQMPIFISVWGAMTGSAVLASDEVFGLYLSSPLGSAMVSNWFSPSWWTAIVLFILMAGGQYISMKLPQWMQKQRRKDVTKLGKNPAVEKQAKTQRTIQIVMFIFIIIMSWSLPAAMGIYWFIGALISILQTYITQKVMAKNKQ